MKNKTGKYSRIFILMISVFACIIIIGAFSEVYEGYKSKYKFEDSVIDQRDINLSFHPYISLSIIGITLTVAIVAFIGVGNVTEVMKIGFEMEKRKDELENTISRLRETIISRDTIIDSIEKKLSSEINEQMAALRFLNRIIIIQSGIDYYERLGAIDEFRNNPQRAIPYKRTLNKVRLVEKSKEGEISKEDEVLYKHFIESLDKVLEQIT